MDLRDILPADGQPQRNYCSGCDEHLDLVFDDFEEVVSALPIRIRGLPFLLCPRCGKRHLPDRSRIAIIEQHKQVLDAGGTGLDVIRQKIKKNFGFTIVPFLYDPDDYFYIPGLYRPFDEGFLTPVFFERRVLLKYDNAPGYRVRFASMTYGEIDTGDDYISFGINKNGYVVMWLGDIAKLTETEQYYLRSENVLSDHSIGSEFYDGQIECVFTELSKENRLFQVRSDFIEACFQRLGKKIAHLDAEVMELSQNFIAPVVDTEKERRHVADTLNKIYIESLDNGVLGKILIETGGDPKNLGSLKRLQQVLEKFAPNGGIEALLTPLYVLYDFRVAYSHLTSAGTAKDILENITDRLGLPTDSSLIMIYEILLGKLSATFECLTKLIVDDHR